MTSVHKGSTKRKRGILDCFNAPKSNVDDHAVGNAPAVLVQVDVHQVDVPVHAQPGGDGLVLPPSLTSPSEITEILVDQPAVKTTTTTDCLPTRAQTATNIFANDPVSPRLFEVLAH